jgi:hypothetical protein
MDGFARTLIWLWRRFEAFCGWYIPAVYRIAALLSDVRRSDGAAANTALSHEAIGLWTALGILTAGAPAWIAVVLWPSINAAIFGRVQE